MTQGLDLDFFAKMLRIDSTSGSEREMADFLALQLALSGASVQMFAPQSPADAPCNLMFAWGKPRVVMCTHLDTVPPYIPPQFEQQPYGDVVVRGRGACDAKGQIFAMAEACRILAAQGHQSMALLLLHGEETGSYGAKEMNAYPGAEYVIVGEPTDNKMATASKGTKAFQVTIDGIGCHSGYPSQGVSAVETFTDLMLKLRAIEWPVDDTLGPTTYNVGMLESRNPQNILSPRLTCRIYFRTTFASDAMVTATMEGLTSQRVHIQPLGGDTPMRYFTLPGFDTTTVAFGSDAPQLKNFRHKLLCGPGSILVAHTPSEHVLVSELAKARDQYVEMYHQLMALPPSNPSHTPT